MAAGSLNNGKIMTNKYCFTFSTEHKKREYHYGAENDTDGGLDHCNNVGFIPKCIISSKKINNKKNYTNRKRKTKKLIAHKEIDKGIRIWAIVQRRLDPHHPLYPRTMNTTRCNLDGEQCLIIQFKAA